MKPLFGGLRTGLRCLLCRIFRNFAWIGKDFGDGRVLLGKQNGFRRRDVEEGFES